MATELPPTVQYAIAQVLSKHFDIESLIQIEESFIQFLHERDSKTMDDISDVLTCRDDINKLSNTLVHILQSPQGLELLVVCVPALIAVMQAET